MELKKALCEAASKLGYSQVKPVQEEVVVTFLSGHQLKTEQPDPGRKDFSSNGEAVPYQE